MCKTKKNLFSKKKTFSKSYSQGPPATLTVGYIYIFMFYITDFLWELKDVFCFYSIFTS